MRRKQNGFMIRPLAIRDRKRFHFFKDANMTKNKWPPWDNNCFLADFHIHSKYSRATSKDMEPEGIGRVARLKGIKVVGTGDFTHPGYLRDLRKTLIPDGSGLYVCKDDPGGTRFILTAEVSNIFTQGGRNRRIHTVLFAPDLETVSDIQERLKKIGNISSDGRPIFGFPVKELVRLVMDSNPDCLVVPAHIWTPWFSLFGAKSGFDTLEECFEEQSCHIHALETGLSSDPQMNWRLSALDTYTLISNSDAHSPWKLGREANIFSCGLSYNGIIQAIKRPEKGFEGTIEFFPEEGKYHYDGHRNCDVCLSPEETEKLGGICPACGQPLTVGVYHRISELADRPPGFVPESSLPCIHLVPLEEIIAEAFGVKSITARVRREYLKTVEMAGPEFDTLIWKSREELEAMLPEKIAGAILAMREERVKVIPGFDGRYGIIRTILPEKDKKAKSGAKEKAPGKKKAGRKRLVQKNLF